MNVDLGEALGATHYAGGVDGLVGRDHYHCLHAVFKAFVGHVACAEDVDHYGLAGVLFHQGDVLVGGGVEYDLRTERPKGIVKPLRLAHVTYDGGEVHLGEALFQFQADVVHGGLGVVKEDEVSDAQGSELSTQLAADGTGGAGYHHGLAVEFVCDYVQGYLDFLTAQEVFNPDFSGAEDCLSFNYLVHCWNYQALDVLLGAEMYEAVLFTLGLFVSREQQGIHAIPQDGLLPLGLVLSGEYRKAVDCPSLNVLVQEAYHLVVGGILEADHCGHAFVRGSVNHHPLVFVLLLDAAVEMVPYQDHHQADYYQKEESGQDVYANNQEH